MHKIEWLGLQCLTTLSNNYCHPWEFFGFEEWGRKREECGCLVAPIYTVASSETLETINKNSTHTVTNSVLCNINEKA
jgi:hypothetical protein